tara:strand:- start:489 stop:5468 length:4980 start_codon:yes stop_codon:yes gene_type:complete
MLTGAITLSATNPTINFNGTSDVGIDMAIIATPEGLDFKEPEDGNKIHFRIYDDTGVDAPFGYWVNGSRMSDASKNLTVGTINSGAITATGYNDTNWNTAYSWGNHALAGYTTTDTTYTSSDFNHDNLTGFVANEHINWTGASAGTIHLTNLPATAITSVQTAVSQVAMLALTTEEGDVVVRSDESKTYMHNGGTAGTMADFTLLATPTDAVTSVDGATGVITLNHDNLTGFVANEHIDWSADQGATNIHTGNYTNTVYTLPFTNNSTNWNTAYTYSQVGHLPLTGGTLTGVTTVKPTTVTGSVVGSNVTLAVEANEGQIQVIADDGGDWASNIVLSNYTASTRRHYWIHNAPSTASANAGKFELRTSVTTTAAAIGGQGGASTVLLNVDPSGNAVFAGTINSGAITATGYNDTNWNTAYGWGNHASANYLSTSNYGTTLTPVYAPVKKGTATLTNAYQTVCTVNGNSLGSSVRMTVTGTGTNTVISTILDIVCNHSLDILVTSQTGTYTLLTVKIVTNNNEDFAVQLKTNSANNLPVNMEVFALNSETVTFTSTNPYTGASLEHECKNGGFASSSSGGAAHEFYSNGTKLVSADDNQALHDTDALSISGSTITLRKGDNTTETVVAPNTVYTLPFTDNSSNWNTAYTYSQVGHLPLAGGTLTGALNIHKTDSAGVLNIRNASDSSANPCTITFSSQGISGTQIGHIKYTHSNTLSYGGHESFTIGGTESTTVILADGQFYYKDGIYEKPATGTGAGTRKDANWDTAYGWGNPSGVYLPLAGGTLTGTLAMGANAITSTGTISSGTITSSGSLVLGSDDVAVEGDANITIREGNAFAGIDLKSLRTAGNISGIRSYNSSNALIHNLLFEVGGRANLNNTGGIALNNDTFIDGSRSIFAHQYYYLNTKIMAQGTDNYLRINQSNQFSSGCWFGNSNILNSSNTYIASGGNGGTTSSRVYMYGGSYNGTNVIALDGTDGKIKGSYYTVGGTTVIDASRNISAGTISSGAITSTVINTGDATLLTLHHDTGVDVAQQKSFIDFSFEDDNTNETPQVRIGAEVGQNANADSQIKEGSGAFVVYTNNATTISGAATGLNERFRVDYLGAIRQTLSNVGIPTVYGKFTMEAADAHMDLVSSTAGTWGSALNFVQGTSTTANTDVWSIARKTTSGGNSLNFNFGTNNQHDNTTQVSISTTGGIAAGAITATGTITGSVFTQSGSSGSSFYAASFSRSGSGTTTPDIWGTGSTLVLGTSSSVESVGFSGANAQFYGTIASGAITARADGSALKIYTATTTGGARVEFSDLTNEVQKGYITYYHANGASYGSGNAFVFDDTENSLSVFVDGKILSKDGFYVGPASGTGGGTIVIDASRNITAGTISCGAISSTGNIFTSGTQITVDPASGDAILSLQGSAGAQTLRIDQNSIRSSTNSPISFLTNSQMSFRLNTDRSVEVTNGDFKIGGTTVIDASRNVSAAKIACTTTGDNTFAGDIIINKAAPWLVIQNTTENSGGIVFNDNQAGIWPAASSQAFRIAYSSGAGNMLTMGHDDDSYTGFAFAIGGNFTASGNVTAYSDERLKTDIKTLDGKKVLQMRGVSFTKDGESGSGVIAQELEKIAPELVYDGKEYKSVAYGNITGYLIEAIKEQQTEIDELKSLVKQLLEK